MIEGAKAEAPDEVLTLNVVPILTEGHIRLPPGAPRTYPLEIDPRKFQRHDLLPAETTKEEIKRALELSAGNVVIPLDISETAAACSHIMLSVWDAQLRQPLDSLIVPVAVRMPESANKGCESGFGAELMRGGADSLVAYGGDSAGSAAATVGLHTFDFEIGGEMRSFAVFAARDANQDHIYGWEMESVLSDRIGRAAALPERVREARKVLLNPGATEDQRKRAYETAAEVLRSSIFAAKSGRGPGEEAAQAALALFKKIASENPEPLTVYARFTRAGSDLYYSPLGLLSANNKVLGKKLRVIQPLPVRNRPDPPCIDSWVIAGSTELLAGVDDPSAKVALDWMLDKESKPAWVREKIHDAARLKAFLRGEGQSKDTAEPTEGVLLLAHHSTDRGFWFGPNDPPILVEDLKRTYAPGSAVVLGACSTAGPAAADDTLERLNSFGVDGMIVSPFPVDAAYTIRLAREIVSALDEAYSKGREATIAEIFGTALNSTAQSYNKEERYAHTEQVGLEYVLAGDPGLRLCKHESVQPVVPPEPPTP